MSEINHNELESRQVYEDEQDFNNEDHYVKIERMREALKNYIDTAVDEDIEGIYNVYLGD